MPEPQRRPRARSVLSFTSNKNRKSIGSFSRATLTETSKEKAAHRVTSKADPTKAINEAQPGGWSPVAGQQALLWINTSNKIISSYRGRASNHGIYSGDTAPRYERRYYKYGEHLLLPVQSTTADIWPADPDRSNPTRPRFERPLDTIRSFEAAMNGAYDKRPFSSAGTWTLLTALKFKSGC